MVDLAAPKSYRISDATGRPAMTIFQLKQFASTSIHAAGAVFWNYDRAELIADGIVHIVGVCFGLIAATVLIVLTAVYATALDVAAVSVYVAGLLAMLVLSSTYNLWPVSRAKWVLRRFDHSAIYLLIAATYTPFIAELTDSYFAIALLIGVWCVAIFGIVLKLASRKVRPACGLALSRDGLERRDAVRCRGGGTAGPGAVVRARGRRLVYAWRDLSCLATVAVPERDLALLCAARRGLPLHRDPRSRAEELARINY